MMPRLTAVTCGAPGATWRSNAKYGPKKLSRPMQGDVGREARQSEALHLRRSVEAGVQVCAAGPISRVRLDCCQNGDDVICAVARLTTEIVLPLLGAAFIAAAAGAGYRDRKMSTLLTGSFTMSLAS